MKLHEGVCVCVRSPEALLLEAPQVELAESKLWLSQPGFPAHEHRYEDDDGDQHAYEYQSIGRADLGGIDGLWSSGDNLRGGGPCGVVGGGRHRLAEGCAEQGQQQSERDQGCGTEDVLSFFHTPAGKYITSLPGGIMGILGNLSVKKLVLSLAETNIV